MKYDSMLFFSSTQSPDMPSWQNYYQCGSGMEMYTENLSTSFIGMTFAQASELCFIKLKLLLLAIEVGGEGLSSRIIRMAEKCKAFNIILLLSILDGGATIVINPKGNHRIQSTTQGFFIAQSADEVKRYDSPVLACWATQVFIAFRSINPRSMAHC